MQMHAIVVSCVFLLLVLILLVPIDKSKSIDVILPAAWRVVRLSTVHIVNHLVRLIY